METEKRTLLSVEDLIKLCEEKKLYSFNSEEHGYKLKLQVPTLFEVDEDVDDAHRGMLKLKFRIFHLGLNRNGSYVSEESAKEAMPTIKNRPILAAIHQLDDGEWDFESHNYEIIKHEDGTEEIVYIEKQVGSFDESEPFFEYDKELDKTYVCGYGYVAEEYTKAADIIRKKNGTKNSCELSIEQFAYNAKEKYLDLQKFYVSASTLLGRKKDGTEIGEGMLGSRADITDFSEENNSQHFDINYELLSEIKKLNENLSHFNINKTKLEEGGELLVTKFEELLNKYNKTVEDINFEYENLSDEELEAKFAEVFEEDTNGEGTDPEPASEGEEGTSDENTDSNNDSETNTNDEPETGDDTDDNTDDDSNKDETDNEVEKFVKSFEISHDDIRNAIYNLLVPYEEADNEYYWIMEVFNNHFVYQGMNGKVYGQKYIVDNDNVTFDGERYELFLEYLTESEKAELESMRSNYSVIESKLSEYQKEEEKKLKEALFESKEYSSIANKEEFIALKENYSEFSSEELKNKLDEIILNYAKNGGLTFSDSSETGYKKVKLPVKSKKKGRYGSLFK